MRFHPTLALLLTLSACAGGAPESSGPTKRESWIRRHVLSGIGLQMDPDAIPAKLTELGYQTRSRICSEGECDRIFTAHGIMKRAEAGELCAPAGQWVALSIIVRDGRVWQVSCLSDGARTLPGYTDRFTGIANSFRGSTTYVYSVDHAFNSYRSLKGCQDPGDLGPPTKEEIEACVGFQPSAGPYIYSTVFPAPSHSQRTRAPSGKITHVFLQNR